jgi:hypothetical protein
MSPINLQLQHPKFMFILINLFTGSESGSQLLSNSSSSSPGSPGKNENYNHKYIVNSLNT